MTIGRVVKIRRVLGKKKGELFEVKPRTRMVKGTAGEEDGELYDKG